MSIEPEFSEVVLAERLPLFDDDSPSPENLRLQKIFTSIKFDREHLKPLATLLLLAVLVSLWFLWHSRARETHLTIPRPTTSEQPATDPSQLTNSQTPTAVVVDVGGRVKHPGVYTLPIGSRAIDALTAAGGALPGTDMTTVNQAQQLEDGEQLIVGADVNLSTAGSAPRSGKVNLNTASVQELDALPGIGPVLAGRIVAWRKTNGRYKSIEDLRQVSGVGDAKFADLRPLVRI